MNPVHFSSASDDWATPQDFFNRIDRHFHFEVDVCASPTNAKCERYFTVNDNGLQQEWRGTCWMNPPYGRGIGDWVKKARLSAIENGATVVCLVPARTDTKWWHDHCVKGEIFFVPGRLKFGNAKHSAPFPCAVVVFRPQVSLALQSTAHLSSIGANHG